MEGSQRGVNPTAAAKAGPSVRIQGTSRKSATPNKGTATQTRMKTVGPNGTVVFKLARQTVAVPISKPATLQTKKRETPERDEPVVIKPLIAEKSNSDSQKNGEPKRLKKRAEQPFLGRAATVEDFVHVSLLDEVPPKKNSIARDYDINVASSSEYDETVSKQSGTLKETELLKQIEDLKSKLASTQVHEKTMCAQGGGSTMIVNGLTTLDSRDGEIMRLKANRLVNEKKTQDLETTIATLNGQIDQLKASQKTQADETAKLQKLYDEAKLDPETVKKAAIDQAAREYLKNPTLGSELRKAARITYYEENKAFFKKAALDMAVAEEGTRLQVGAYEEYLNRNPTVKPLIVEELVSVMRKDVQVRAACQLRIRAELKPETIAELTRAAVDEALLAERAANQKRWDDEIKVRDAQKEADRIEYNDLLRDYEDLKRERRGGRDRDGRSRDKRRDRKRSRSRSRGSSSKP